MSTRGGLFLPGGGQDPGESPEAAAVRETFEECGLRVEVVRLIGTADQLVFAAGEGKHYRKRCAFFLARVVGDGGVPEPGGELVWLPAAVAVTTLRHASQRWAVAEAGLH